MSFPSVKSKCHQCGESSLLEYRPYCSRQCHQASYDYPRRPLTDLDISMMKDLKKRGYTRDQIAFKLRVSYGQTGETN